MLMEQFIIDKIFNSRLYGERIYAFTQNIYDYAIFSDGYTSFIPLFYFSEDAEIFKDNNLNITEITHSKAELLQLYLIKPLVFTKLDRRNIVLKYKSNKEFSHIIIR